jgi:uncharacterized protein (DUF1800 family)
MRRHLLVSTLLAALSLPAAAVDLPYRAAGLDEPAAAAILLDRLAYGARPGELERVLDLGLETWVERQLAAAEPEAALETRLTAFPALRMSHQERVARYPGSGLVSAHARRFYDLIPPPNTPVDNDWRNRKLARFREEQGFLTPEKELQDELQGQKVVRAVHAENQLREVLTDLWVNHFHVSAASFRARPWVLAYEQEAIRPHVLGRFRELLQAAEKHPAMLQYLLETVPGTPLDPQRSLLAHLLAQRPAEFRAVVQAELQALEEEQEMILPRQFRYNGAANRDHARVLLELHTLGPAAAYGEADMDGIARAFTGWSTRPLGPSPQWFAGVLTQAQQAGFVQQGSFLFRADWHDAGAKRALGRRLPAGGGVEEGERILDLLAAHPATARHVAYKLAARFVADEPPPRLVEALARRYRRSDGDLAQLMRTLLESPEFWQAAAPRSKLKTPFEYAVSALRASGSEVQDARALAVWIERMGQPLYGHLTPDGQPEQATHWLQPDSLQQRLAFAAALNLAVTDPDFQLK